MNTKKIKRAFTLLEISISVAILVLIASVTSVHIKQLLDVHRFEGGVETLFSRLQEAQVLAASYGVDLSLDIEKKEGGVWYQFLTDDPQVKKRFPEKEVLLPQVVSFKTQGKQVCVFHQDIYSGGRLTPPGVVTFIHAEGDENNILYLDLQYGHLIKFSRNRPRSFTSVAHLQKPEQA